METEFFELFDDYNSYTITEQNTVIFEEVFPSEINELADSYMDIDIDSSLSAAQDISVAEDMQQESIFDSFINLFDDVYNSIAGDEHTVTIDNFSADGTIDLKHNVIVEGNVAHDIQFTDRQTNSSCSLMAQEQFVNRYTGQSIPEEYLEWQAGQWGVYDPVNGTSEEGQSMILDHFNIPHGPHKAHCEIEDLNEAISAKEDILIGVDAREFYNDPSFPPGSGHAVAIVGRGIDPTTGEVAGFYVTDSNFPQTARFVNVEKMQNSWFGDMITVPEKSIV